MMMVDIFAGILLGVPFGKHVSSMYHDLSEGRNLGQIHIVMDPSRFVGLDAFKKSMSQSLDELGEMPAAEGFGKVRLSGRARGDETRQGLCDRRRRDCG